MKTYVKIIIAIVLTIAVVGSNIGAFFGGMKFCQYEHQYTIDASGYTYRRDMKIINTERLNKDRCLCQFEYVYDGDAYIFEYITEHWYPIEGTIATLTMWNNGTIDPTDDEIIYLDW